MVFVHVCEDACELLQQSAYSDTPFLDDDGHGHGEGDTTTRARACGGHQHQANFLFTDDLESLTRQLLGNNTGTPPANNSKLQDQDNSHRDGDGDGDGTTSLNDDGISAAASTTSTNTNTTSVVDEHNGNGNHSHGHGHGSNSSRDDYLYPDVLKSDLSTLLGSLLGLEHVHTSTGTPDSMYTPSGSGVPSVTNEDTTTTITSSNASAAAGASSSSDDASSSSYSDANQTHRTSTATPTPVITHTQSRLRMKATAAESSAALTSASMLRPNHYNVVLKRRKIHNDSNSNGAADSDGVNGIGKLRKQQQPSLIGMPAGAAAAAAHSSSKSVSVSGSNHRNLNNRPQPIPQYISSQLDGFNTQTTQSASMSIAEESNLSPISPLQEPRNLRSANHNNNSNSNTALPDDDPNDGSGDDDYHEVLSIIDVTSGRVEAANVVEDLSLGMKLSLVGGQVIVQAIKPLGDGRASPAQLTHGKISVGDVLCRLNGKSLRGMGIATLAQALDPLKAPTVPAPAPPTSSSTIVPRNLNGNIINNMNKSRRANTNQPPFSSAASLPSPAVLRRSESGTTPVGRVVVSSQLPPQHKQLVVRDDNDNASMASTIMTKQTQRSWLPQPKQQQQQSQSIAKGYAATVGNGSGGGGGGGNNTNNSSSNNNNNDEVHLTFAIGMGLMRQRLQRQQSDHAVMASAEAALFSPFAQLMTGMAVDSFTGMPLIQMNHHPIPSFDNNSTSNTTVTTATATTTATVKATATATSRKTDTAAIRRDTQTKTPTSTPTGHIILSSTNTNTTRQQKLLLMAYTLRWLQQQSWHQWYSPFYEDSPNRLLRLQHNNNIGHGNKDVDGHPHNDKGGGNNNAADATSMRIIAEESKQKKIQAAKENFKKWMELANHVYMSAETLDIKQLLNMTDEDEAEAKKSLDEAAARSMNHGASASTSAGHLRRDNHNSHDGLTLWKENLLRVVESPTNSSGDKKTHPTNNNNSNSNNHNNNHNIGEGVSEDASVTHNNGGVTTSPLPTMSGFDGLAAAGGGGGMMMESLLFGTQVTSMLNKTHHSKALPDPSVTLRLYEEANEAATGATSNVLASREIREKHSFLLNTIFPKWLESFKPLRWQYRRVLWPLIYEHEASLEGGGGDVIGGGGNNHAGADDTSSLGGGSVTSTGTSTSALSFFSNSAMSKGGSGGIIGASAAKSKAMAKKSIESLVEEMELNGEAKAHT
jgi:hypothetical protein